MPVYHAICCKAKHRQGDRQLPSLLLIYDIYLCSETGCLKGWNPPGHPSTPEKTVLTRLLLNMKRSGDQEAHSFRVLRVCGGETPVNTVMAPRTSHILRGRLWTVVPVLPSRLKLMRVNGKDSTPPGKWPRACLVGGGGSGKACMVLS